MFGYGRADCPYVQWGYNSLSAWAADTDNFPWWSQALPVSFEVSSWGPQTTAPISFNYAGHFLTTKCPPPFTIGAYYIDLVTDVTARGDGSTVVTSINGGHCTGLKYPQAKKTTTSTSDHYGGRTVSDADYTVCIANPKYQEAVGERCDVKG